MKFETLSALSSRVDIIEESKPAGKLEGTFEKNHAEGCTEKQRDGIYHIVEFN